MLASLLPAPVALPQKITSFRSREASQHGREPQVEGMVFLRREAAAALLGGRGHPPLAL